MAKDAHYDAALELAKGLLQHAWEAFRADERISWKDMPANVPKAQARVWVDALSDVLEHHRQMRRCSREGQRRPAVG
jgi:hypothetical protein